MHGTTGLDLVGKLLVVDPLATALVRDRPVLAEDTAQVAVGEEDRARAALADQRDLFTEVRLCAVDHHLSGCTAEPLVAGVAVDAALAGAEGAGVEKREGLLDPFGELTVVLELAVGG